MRVTKSQNTTMVIRSRHLINALAAVVEYYPGISFTADEVKIQAPYYVLIHHRSALELYKDSQPETHDEEYASTTCKHIDILLGFLEQTYSQRIHEEALRHSRTIPTATYEWLWLLLRPGEVVYTQFDNTWTPFVISRVFKKAHLHEEGSSYSVVCWNYVHHNHKLCRRMHQFEISPFSGEEAIHNLPAIPAPFFTGVNKDTTPEESTAEQIRLGKLVWELYKKPTYKQYDGDLAKKTTTPHYDYSACPTGYMSGRVIVDGEGYERWSRLCPLQNRRRFPPNMNGNTPPSQLTTLDQLPYFAPRCGCGACGKAESGNDELSSYAAFQTLDPRQDEAPESDLFYHVLSKIVAGFLLGERRWGHFHVEMLCDIKFDREAFKYLVLDDEIKTTVKALIGKFASDEGHISAWPNDFVKNKGQGRIFLLHGSPGVGKTCTAECVAELTHRPLLSLTSGDLSTSSFKVEQNLEYFLELGERFGAIVLLDEADVYLESRRNKNIARNGLVSVFLRALEYYRGVLFLTTNRVQTFDAAFTSRIHVALHYGPLGDADRERIWLNGFERLERDSGRRVRASVAVREYAWTSRDVRSLRWNGREIRNALQTAVALAESEAVEDEAEIVLLTDKHLRSVVRMSRGFKNFMRRCRARDDDDEDDDGYDGKGRRAVYDDDDDDDDDDGGNHEDGMPRFSDDDDDDGVLRAEYH
ncbi:P-loop containing nucleoside triphosphate hydrolase protein [Xylaria digitata]|nr:P-loop containing nucleoside triphosphate hydrolase protein [Xylaria digitata]